MMLPLENTFTYTARSANDPQKVVTFTLHDDRMSVDVAALVEQVERAAALQGDGQEVEDEEVVETEMTAQARPWLTPGVVSLMERVTEPFHISDVDAESPNGGLQVTAWVRTRNLRLAPILFRMEQVDNPQAADDFVGEIKRRKEETPPAKRMPGPFDYWAGWMLGALAAGALAAWLLPKRDQGEEAVGDETPAESD
jgi:hypothetical protein